MNRIKTAVALLVICFALASMPTASAQQIPPPPFFPDPPEAPHPPEAIEDEYTDAWWTIWTAWFPVVGQLDNPFSQGFKECVKVSGIDNCVGLWSGQGDNYCNLWLSTFTFGCWID